jgi:hypothetical protein
MSISALTVPNTFNVYSDSSNIGGNCIIKGNLTVDGTVDFTNISITGDLDLTGKITTTNTSPDSIKTSGGIQVAGDGTFNNVTVADTLTTNVIEYSQKEIIQSEEDSTGLNTGASQVRGGESVDKHLFVGLGINSLSPTNSTSNTDQNASIVCGGGMSVNNDVCASNFKGTVITDSITSPSNNLQITSTNSSFNGNLSASNQTLSGDTPSADYSHGTLVISGSGGLGVGGNINNFGNISSQGSLSSKSLNVTNNGSFGSLTMTNTVNKFSTDGTLSENSNNNVPTEYAIKTYVDTHSGGLPTNPSFNTVTLTSTGDNSISTSGGLSGVTNIFGTGSGVFQRLLGGYDTLEWQFVGSGQDETRLYSNVINNIFRNKSLCNQATANTSLQLVNADLSGISISSADIAVSRTGTLSLASSGNLTTTTNLTVSNNTTTTNQYYTWGTITIGTGAGPFNDVPIGNGKNFRVNNSSFAGSHITGFSGGTDGRVVTIIYNLYPATTGNTLNIDNDSTSSLAQNRVLSPTGGGINLNPNSCSSVDMVYDGSISRWVVTCVTP